MLFETENGRAFESPQQKVAMRCSGAVHSLCLSRCVHVCLNKWLARDASGEKKVAFTLADTSHGVDPICDGCENFTRWHLKTRSRGVAAQEFADPTVALGVLSRLAWYWVLGRSGIGRITVSHVQDYERLGNEHDEFLARLADLWQLKRQMAKSPTHVVGLSEYIKQKGNPVLNKHTVVPARTATDIRLFVAVPEGLQEKGPSTFVVLQDTYHTPVKFRGLFVSIIKKNRPLLLVRRSAGLLEGFRRHAAGGP